MAEKIFQIDRANSGEVIVVSPSELAALVEQCIREKITKHELCSGGCGGSSSDEQCTTDTRLSQQRKANLMRQGTDLYAFTTQLPLAPGETKTWNVPKFPIGRVIENLFFRPTMADGGNVDDIQVEILGEDGVRWAIFTGGRHNGDHGCCLLEFFRQDCIGYDEGFIFRLTHLGSVGQPNMVRAVADWNYLFPNASPRPERGWCWPKGRRY